MVLRAAAIATVVTLLSGSGGVDVPPASLVQENIRKASVIVRGTIESWEAPKPGVTVARLRVNRVYRGSVKPGDDVAFASFKEADRYPDRLLHVELVVFLRPRLAQYAPPRWETATDLSEFIFVPELERLIASRMRRQQR